MIYVKIGGTYLPSGVKLEAKSTKISKQEEGSRRLAKFTLIDMNTSGTAFHWSDLVGKLVQIYEDGDLKFAGSIDEPATRELNQIPSFKSEFQCIDHTFITERIFINKGYEKQEIADIVKDIIDTYLATDGITYTAGSIQTTGTDLSMNCPYIQCRQAFNEICELIGYQWRISDTKVFYFDDRTASEGTSLTDASGYLIKTLDFSENRRDYRNKQILRNVHAITDTLTEVANPVPDNNRSYYLRFAINEKPNIYVSASRTNPLESELIDPRFIGINGLDTDMYWYWNKGSSTVTQDTDQTLVPDGYYVVVKYKGQYTIDIVEEDSAEIADRISIEGGSGLYEAIESGANIESILIGEMKADALLRKYGRIPKFIKVSSYNHPTWEQGQIIDVVLPKHNINSLISEGNGYYIQSCTDTDTGNKFMKTVKLVDGEPMGGWVNFFRNLISKENNLTIREDAIVAVNKEIDEEYSWDGEIDVTVFDILVPANNQYPSDSLTPGTVSTSTTLYD